MNEDTRNMVLAIALSIFVLIGWNVLQPVFFPPPPAPPVSETAQSGDAGIPSAANAPAGDAAGVPTVSGGVVSADGTVEATREDALALAPRVTIETPRIRGSINLRGGRFDDLILSDYRQELDEESPPIELLLPTGGDRPYFAQFGWAGQDGLVVPDGESVWEADGTLLAPGSPVTLRWTSSEGVTFVQALSVDENYMFSVDQRIENRTSSTVTAAPYGRIFRSGLPETLGFYILHEGLIGVFDGVLEERDYDDVSEEVGGQEAFSTTGGWMGITDKYWLVALIPDQSLAVESTFRHTGRAGDQYHVNFLSPLVSVDPGATAAQASNLFAGAKETILLDGYRDNMGITNFDLAVDFGWFYFLTKPIFYAIHWLNEVLGNFGLAILALTVGIKIVFFPLANKSYRSMSKMKLVQPKIVELREKYGDDKQKLQQEMMEIYKKEKVNPLAGCLPVLVQIPVFFALYKVLFVTIEMRHAPFYGWIDDLSAPDPTGILELFGMVPWEVPALLAILNIGLWPIIMGLTMWAQQKLNPPPADPIQQRIFGLMPIFFTFILGGFPAGLVIYWAWNNALSILQQYVIMRRMGVAIGGGKIEEKSE